jgi:hypothetical protein
MLPRAGSGISRASGSVVSFMTRHEIASAVQSALRTADLPLTLISIRALPYAWELRLEDLDGTERFITVHHGSVAAIERAITDALDPRNSCC